MQASQGFEGGVWIFLGHRVETTSARGMLWIIFVGHAIWIHFGGFNETAALVCEFDHIDPKVKPATVESCKKPQISHRCLQVASSTREERIAGPKPKGSGWLLGVNQNPSKFPPKVMATSGQSCSHMK